MKTCETVKIRLTQAALAAVAAAFLISCASIGYAEFANQNKPIKGLSLRWAFKVSDKELFDLWPREQSAPAYADGVIYVSGRDGELFALDSEKLTVIWKSKLKEPVTALPVVHKGVLYAADGNGYMCALDAKTGEQKWRAFLNDEAAAKPVIDGDFLYVKTSSGSIFSLSLADGAKKWQIDADAPDGMLVRSASSPIIIDGLLVASLAGARIIAADKTSGKQKWLAAMDVPKSNLVDDAASDPIYDAASGQIIAAFYENGLVSVSPKDGSILWTYNKLTRITGASLINGILIVSSPASGLVGLTIPSGKETKPVQTWSLRACATDKVNPSKVIPWGQVFVFSCTSSDSGINVLSPFDDKTKPQLLTAFSPGNGVYSMPAVMNDYSLAALSNGGYLYVLDYVYHGLNKPKAIPSDTNGSDFLK